MWAGSASCLEETLPPFHAPFIASFRAPVPAEYSIGRHSQGLRDTDSCRIGRSEILLATQHSDQRPSRFVIPVNSRSKSGYQHHGLACHLVQHAPWDASLPSFPTDRELGIPSVNPAQPLSGHLFAFLNRRRNRLKSLCNASSRSAVWLWENAATFLAGSDEGAHHAAVLYSLLRTCALHRVKPHPYLTDVLHKLASGWKNSRLDELLPENWPPATV